MSKNQKKDHRKSNLSRRMGVRRIKQSFLIVCEGENTEPDYFKAFRMTAATIKAVGQGMNTVSLVYKAISIREAEKAKKHSYDQCWVVFDKDDYPDNDFSVTDHKQKAVMRQAINDAVRSLIREYIGATDAKLSALDPSANQEFFLWHTWFKDVFDGGGFDIVIANPPYGAKYDDADKKYFKTAFNTAKTISGVQKGSLDTYTLFIEHGYNILKNGGNFAYIVPISITSSDSLAGVHKLLMEYCDNIHISSYAVRPEPVFKNACIDVSILLFQKTNSSCKNIYSTKMYRKKKGLAIDLQKLVDNLQFVNINGLALYGRFPKIGTEIEKEILNKILKQKELSGFIHSTGRPIYYRTSGGRYFKVVTNYPTGSTKEKAICFQNNIANCIGCILSSNLSFWFYQVFSNNHDWKIYEIEHFTIPLLTNENITKLNNLYIKYLNDIESNANIRISSGQSSYTVDSFKEYKIVRSKAIIDEIDDYIGPLYGLTKEEIDFIKNYELEFRMAGE